MPYYDGNKKKNSITIISQNIPGCYGSNKIEIKLRKLVFCYHPTVLCLNEVRLSVIKTYQPSKSYTH